MITAFLEHFQTLSILPLKLFGLNFSITNFLLLNVLILITIIGIIYFNSWYHDYLKEVLFYFRRSKRKVASNIIKSILQLCDKVSSVLQNYFFRLRIHTLLNLKTIHTIFKFLLIFSFYTLNSVDYALCVSDLDSIDISNQSVENQRNNLSLAKFNINKCIGSLDYLINSISQETNNQEETIKRLTVIGEKVNNINNKLGMVQGEYLEPTNTKIIRANYIRQDALRDLEAISPDIKILEESVIAKKRICQLNWNAIKICVGVGVVLVGYIFRSSN